MKKLLLSSVALLGLTVGATAADLPRRVAPVPYVPVPVFTWTGFYLGVNAGWGWVDRNDDPCLGGAFTGACGFTSLSALTVPSFPAGALVPVGPVFGGPTFNNFGFAGNDNRRDGFVGGGQIGYNYQFTPGSGLVIGIEADAQYSDIGRRNRDDNFFGFGGFNGFVTANPVLPAVAVFPGPSFGVAPTVPGALGNIALFNGAIGNGFNGFNGSDRSNRSEFLGTVRGRLGWAFDRLLIYATGGVAFTDNRRNDNNCFGGLGFAGCGFGFNGGFASGAAVPANFFVGPASALNASRVVSTSTNTSFFGDRRRNDDVRPVAGGGIEYAFTNNLTVKLEGLYVFDNNRNRNDNFFGGGFGTGGGIIGVTNTGAPVIATANNFGLGFDNRRRDDLAIVRAGINWKFNGWIW